MSSLTEKHRVTCFQASRVLGISLSSFLGSVSPCVTFLLQQALLPPSGEEGDQSHFQAYFPPPEKAWSSRLWFLQPLHVAGLLSPHTTDSVASDTPLPFQ